MPFLPRVPIGRWPRRLAAGACLLLAAGTALTPKASTSSARPPGSHLSPGQRAVPVRVVGPDPRAYLLAGAHIDLIAMPADDYGTTQPTGSQLLAQSVVVVKVVAPAGGLSVGSDAADSELIVAVDAVTALRIAYCAAHPCLAAADDPP